MANLVHRTVMFKVAEDDKQEQLLHSIEKLAKDARKVCIYLSHNQFLYQSRES